MKRKTFTDNECVIQAVYGRNGFDYHEWGIILAFDVDFTALNAVQMLSIIENPFQT